MPLRLERALACGVFCAATFGGVADASSPSPSPSATTTLPTIGSVRVATGTESSLHRLPVTAAVIDARSTATANEPLDAALRALPGFDRTRANGAFSNYGLNRLSISGAGVDRAALVIDGVPGVDPFGGQIDWAALPAQAIGRAEILLGPGSALYGSGAIGGLLDIRTFSAGDVDGGVFFRPSLTVGGISQESTVIAGAAEGRWRLGAWADTSRTTFAALPPAYTGTDSRPATSVAATARATARYAHGGLTLDLGTLFGSDGQDEGRPNYTFSRNFDQADVGLTLAGAPSVSLRAYDRRFNVINAADAFPSAPGRLLYTQSVPSSDTGYSLDVAQASPRETLLLRAEIRVARGTSTQVSATNAVQDAGGGRQQTEALAAQGEWRFGSLRALAGARVDGVLTDVWIAGTGSLARSNAALSPRLALSWSLGPRLVVRAYGGTGLRTPFLNELVRAYRIGATNYDPNPGLVPERSRSGGLGLDFVSGATRATLDVQSTAVFDALAFRTISPTLQIRSNVSATRTDGVQFSLQHSAACGVADVSASAHYARVTADADRTLLGDRLPYVPAASVSAGWSGGRSVTGSVRLSYVGQTYADDRNAMSLPPATILDLSLALPLTWGSVAGGVDNATGARYLSSPDRLGRPSNIWVRVGTKRPPPCVKNAT